MDKKEIRAMIREARAAFPDGVRDSEAVWKKVESLEEFKHAGTVLIYWSLPGEVITESFIEKWHGRKRIILPLVEGDDLRLKEYCPGKLKEGFRGIMEPSADATEVSPEEIDFAIIPGVAFDSHCERLGRGRGFYDRLLPAIECPVAGVGYDFQIVEEVPINERDQHLSMVVTPTYLFIR